MAKLNGIKGFNYKRLAQDMGPNFEKSRNQSWSDAETLAPYITENIINEIVALGTMSQGEVSGHADEINKKIIHIILSVLSSNEPSIEE